MNSIEINDVADLLFGVLENRASFADAAVELGISRGDFDDLATHEWVGKVMGYFGYDDVEQICSLVLLTDPETGDTDTDAIIHASIRGIAGACMISMILGYATRVRQSR